MFLHVEHHPAKRKSRARAQEQILRSYGGKAERVLDFLRSTIIVDRISQVRDVLKLVMDEVDVHIIKNRFDPLYDGFETGGYRDVNVQLSFPEFDGTPWEGHIVELQIHLRAIIEIKTEAGHAQYVSCRNLSGN